MTDLPNPRPDGSANPTRADIETPAGDPELAALVGRYTPSDDGDPSLAALVSVDPVPVMPLAPAVTDWQPPAPPRRRRSFALRFGLAFVFGFVLAIGVGAGALYAWDQQYDGRVLPGVRVGSIELGGLTREQAAAEIANAYAWLGNGQITLTGPDGKTTTMSYADLGRGADTSAILDAALAAGRQGEPIVNLIGEARAALRGVTLDPAVTVSYDRDKLAAAIDTLDATIDQTAVDASVSAKGGKFTFSPAKDGRAVDKAALLTALDEQLVSPGAPTSITMAVPVVSHGTHSHDRNGRGGKGRRGTDVHRRGRRPGRGHLEDRRHEPRAAGLVLDRRRRQHHPGP